ncbi:MAG: glycosyltransferase [Bacteroidetes bacterium]|nr:glycosyltransferase [Bacteroidota bacterium]
MIGIIGIIFFCFLIIQVTTLLAIFRPEQHSWKTYEDLPKVSILLAARNEEELILRSLESIDALRYPSNKLQVLIGDDASTDRTAELVKDFISTRKNFQLISIGHNLGKSRGKANVLAHLAHEANGEFYFITDVDVKLPENWIIRLLSTFTDEVGISSGTSTCETGETFFSKLQSIDWLHFMGYIKGFANLNVGCTSVGNNMVVRAKAYWETGGYEAIDFSITEDYKLFKEVTANGWQWRTSLDPDCLGLATAIPTIKEMLHQRKRWLIGARELPTNWKFFLILYGMFIPALVAGMVWYAQLTLMIWLSKFLIQSFFILILQRKAGIQISSIGMLIVYEVYVLVNTFVTALFYFMPIKAIWKGRTYSEKDLV